MLQWYVDIEKQRAKVINNIKAKDFLNSYLKCLMILTEIYRKEQYIEWSQHLWSKEWI